MTKILFTKQNNKSLLKYFILSFTKYKINMYLTIYSNKLKI